MRFLKIILINFLVFIFLSLLLGVIYHQLKKSRPVISDKKSPIINYNIKDLAPAPKEYAYDNSFLYEKYPNGTLDRPFYETSMSMRNLNNRRNKKIRSYKMIKDTDEKIYDVVYTFNSLGHRLVKNQEKKINPKYAVSLFGCSFTFGEGLQDGLDYPSLLAGKLGNSWKVYNYGYMGYGPNSTLQQIMEQQDYFDDQKEDADIFFWYYITDHLSRYFCPLECYNKDRYWATKMPDISVKNGAMEYHGSFLQSPYFYRKLGQLYNTLKINQHIDLPAVSLTTEQIKEFAAAVDHIAQQLKNKPLKKILLIHSFDEYTADLASSFTDLGFDIINLDSVMKDIPLEKRELALDHHPNQLANWYVSEILKKYLSDNLKMDVNK